MEEAENGHKKGKQRKCSMVHPKLITQERIITNLGPQWEETAEKAEMTAMT